MMQPEPIVYGGYTQAELNDQYDQRTLVPDLSAYVKFWRDGTQRARRELDCVTDVSYGPSAAERLDIYRPAGAGAPVHVYLHGGAWRALGTDESGFPALHLVPAGACYVALNFATIPDASLEEMIRQARAALAWVYRNIAGHGGDPERIFISGHSSGAHMAAMLLADGWRAAAGLPESLIKGAVLVSGPYDLEPVRLSARNDFLHLDKAAARRMSPIHNLPPSRPPLFVGWGDGELDEFRRQGRAFADACIAAGFEVSAAEIANCNHFDASNAFAEPEKPVVPAALAQMGL